MIFFLRRSLASLIQLFVLSVVLFLFFRVLPGDIYTAELGDPQVSRQTIEALREAAGLKNSWPHRYRDWAASCFKGDFGASLAYGIPVSRLVARRIPKTLAISASAMALAWLLGIGGGLLAVRFRWTVALDPGVAAAAMVPDVIAVSLLLWLAVEAGVPIGGAWLPIAALTSSILPVVFLHVSREVCNAREIEFVRIAESRGISGARLWLRFILPAAANPLVSLAGLTVAATIGASFVVEALTGWPGLGPLFLEAVQARDYPVVQTILMLLATVLALSNLAADLTLYHLDPRIRLPHET
jgi:ABC-type dipeptide/oligopeptide/nickel transport system permease component